MCVLSLINISSKYDPETTHASLGIHASLLEMWANFIGFLLLDSVSGHFLIRS